MNWNKEISHLPEHNQEVLVRSKSAVHLAVYNGNDKVFTLQNGGAIDPSKERVIWMELTKDKE